MDVFVQALQHSFPLYAVVTNAVLLSARQEDGYKFCVKVYLPGSYVNAAVAH